MLLIKDAMVLIVSGYQRSVTSVASGSMIVGW